MSLRTNTNRALKIARMTIAYGVGNWHLKRILKTRTDTRIPARHVVWVIKQARKELNHERL